eukprot:392379-Rhodomonas_salina.2
MAWQTIQVLAGEILGRKGCPLFPHKRSRQQSISQNEGEEFDVAVWERLAKRGFECYVAHLIVLAVPSQVDCDLSYLPASAQKLGRGLLLVAQQTLVCRLAPNTLGSHGTRNDPPEQLKHPASTLIGHASASTMEEGLPALFTEEGVRDEAAVRQ